MNKQHNTHMSIFFARVKYFTGKKLFHIFLHGLLTLDLFLCGFNVTFAAVLFNVYPFTYLCFQIDLFIYLHIVKRVIVLNIKNNVLVNKMYIMPICIYLYGQASRRTLQQE